MSISRQNAKAYRDHHVSRLRNGRFDSCGYTLTYGLVVIGVLSVIPKGLSVPARADTSTIPHSAPASGINKAEAPAVGTTLPALADKHDAFRTLAPAAGSFTIPGLKNIVDHAGVRLWYDTYNKKTRPILKKYFKHPYGALRILAALMNAESRFNPYLCHNDRYGIMQITEDTWHSIQPNLDMKNPMDFSMVFDIKASGIVGGNYFAMLLQDMERQFPQRDKEDIVLLALAAYHFGTKVVANGAPPKHVQRFARGVWIQSLAKYPTFKFHDTVTVPPSGRFQPYRDMHKALQSLRTTKDDIIAKFAMKQRPTEVIFPVVEYKMAVAADGVPSPRESRTPFVVFADKGRLVKLSRSGISKYAGSDEQEVRAVLRRHALKGLTGPEKGLVLYVYAGNLVVSKKMEKKWDIYHHELRQQLKRYAQVDDDGKTTLCLPYVRYMPANKSEDLAAFLAWQIYGPQSGKGCKPRIIRHGVISEYVLPQHTVVKNCLKGMLKRVRLTAFGYEAVVESKVGSHTVEQVFGRLGGVRRDIRGREVKAGVPIGFVGTFGKTKKVSRFLFVLKVNGKGVDWMQAPRRNRDIVVDDEQLERVRSTVRSWSGKVIQRLRLP